LSADIIFITNEPIFPKHIKQRAEIISTKHT